MKNNIQKLESITNGTLVLGAEVEFYIKDQQLEQAKKLLSQYSLINERGKNQYEISFGPYYEFEQFVSKCIEVQKTLKYNDCFIHTAKPFLDDASNSFHIHINIISSKDGVNLFESSSHEEALLLKYAVGGLLEFMEGSLPYFAPDKESHLRYTPSPFNPTKICWGGNNRTTALRIPPKSAGPRRIEHRVPSSTCKMPETIYVIINAIYYGIKNEVTPPEKIFGNAFLNQYEAKKIIP